MLEKDYDPVLEDLCLLPIFDDDQETEDAVVQGALDTFVEAVAEEVAAAGGTAEYLENGPVEEDPSTESAKALLENF